MDETRLDRENQKKKETENEKRAERIYPEAADLLYDVITQTYMTSSLTRMSHNL